MHRRAIAITALAALLMSATPAVQAAWVWSPQTGWVGPAGAVKDTPEEQLAWSLVFFEKEDYERARLEFRKLLKAYPDSRFAPEAQFHLGRCEEALGDYYQAFLEYRRTILVYPSTHRFDEVVEHEYRIANYFLAGKKRKLFGIAALLPAKDKAIEIFEAISEDAPFSEYGQLAQYKLGLAFLSLREYEQAVNAFEQIILQYPESPLVDDARYQIAQASLKGTFRAGYDQLPTDQAVRELEAFLREYPGSELVTDASDRLEELQERRALHEYEVGEFYEAQDQPAAARIYYRTVITQYPKSSLAAKAAERLELLPESH